MHKPGARHRSSVSLRTGRLDDTYSPQAARRVTLLALSIVASVLLLVPAAAMAQAPAAATAQGWPTGIPAAPFGTSADAPRATFFVNSTDPAATDANNPNGTATKPRATIPTPLPAGAVVEVRGGPYTITTTLKGA